MNKHDKYFYIALGALLLEAIWGAAFPQYSLVAVLPDFAHWLNIGLLFAVIFLGPSQASGGFMLALGWLVLLTGQHIIFSPVYVEAALWIAGGVYYLYDHHRGASHDQRSVL